VDVDNTGEENSQFTNTVKSW